MPPEVISVERSASATPALPAFGGDPARSATSTPPARLLKSPQDPVLVRRGEENSASERAGSAAHLPEDRPRAALFFPGVVHGPIRIEAPVCELLRTPFAHWARVYNLYVLCSMPDNVRRRASAYAGPLHTSVEYGAISGAAYPYPRYHSTPQLPGRDLALIAANVRLPLRADPRSDELQARSNMSASFQPLQPPEWRVHRLRVDNYWPFLTCMFCTRLPTSSQHWTL